MKDRGLTKGPLGSGGAAEVTSLVSDFRGLEGPSCEKRRRLRHQRRFAAAKTVPDGGAGASLIAHRTPKTAVNPLTRLASRIVMQRNYQSPHVEGPAATFDTLSDHIACQTAKSDWRFFGRGIIGLAQ